MCREKDKNNLNWTLYHCAFLCGINFSFPLTLMLSLIPTALKKGIHLSGLNIFKQKYQIQNNSHEQPPTDDGKWSIWEVRPSA